jgi:hypothetical protein
VCFFKHEQFNVLSRYLLSFVFTGREKKLHGYGVWFRLWQFRAGGVRHVARFRELGK